VRSYSGQSRGLGQLAREAAYLARARSGNVAEHVAGALDGLRTVERLVSEELGAPVEGLTMLDVGAGQLLVQMTYFTARGNRVIGIDQDVIAQGFDLPRYVEMWRANGGTRVAKTLIRKALLVDMRTRRELRRRLGVGGPLRLEVHRMDAAAMSFPDSVFDVVYALAVFQHLERPAAVIDEIARVLRPGGVLYLDFILYTSATGSHDVRLLGGRHEAVAPWAHLRSELADSVRPNAFLNRLRLPDWRALFESRLAGARLHLERPDADRLEPVARALQERGELTEYGLEELLTHRVAVLWRKPVA